MKGTYNKFDTIVPEVLETGFSQPYHAINLCRHWHISQELLKPKKITDLLTLYLRAKYLYRTKKRRFNNGK